MPQSKKSFGRLFFSVLLFALPVVGAVADEPAGKHRSYIATLEPGECLEGQRGTPRGYLGIETTSLTPELRRHFGVSDNVGVLVSRVVKGSAAAAAGIEVGDVITRVDGEAIETTLDLSQAIRSRDGGEVVDVEYARRGQPSRTRATLESRERCALDVGAILEGLDLGHLKNLGNLEHLGELDLDIDIDTEALGEALSNIGEVFGNQDWEKHFEALENINLEQIEERMEEVQERLKELEVRLEREHERLGETHERHLERAERERERAERQRERVHQDRERVERQARERAVRERQRGEEEAGVEAEELEEDGGGVY